MILCPRCEKPHADDCPRINVSRRWFLGAALAAPVMARTPWAPEPHWLLPPDGIGYLLAHAPVIALPPSYMPAPILLPPRFERAHASMVKRAWLSPEEFVVEHLTAKP